MLKFLLNSFKSRQYSVADKANIRGGVYSGQRDDRNAYYSYA